MSRRLGQDRAGRRQVQLRTPLHVAAVVRRCAARDRRLDQLVHRCRAAAARSRPPRRPCDVPGGRVLGAGVPEAARALLEPAAVQGDALDGPPRHVGAAVGQEARRVDGDEDAAQGLRRPGGGVGPEKAPLALPGASNEHAVPRLKEVQVDRHTRAQLAPSAHDEDGVCAGALLGQRLQLHLRLFPPLFQPVRWHCCGHFCGDGLICGMTHRIGDALDWSPALRAGAAVRSKLGRLQQAHAAEGVPTLQREWLAEDVETDRALEVGVVLVRSHI